MANGNLATMVYRRVQASEASAVSAAASSSRCFLPQTRCSGFLCMVPLSEGAPFLLRTAQIYRPPLEGPHVASNGFLLADKHCDLRVAKARFFFFLNQFLKPRTPPMTHLLSWRSEARPRRRFGGEMFFCILRRLMVRVLTAAAQPRWKSTLLKSERGSGGLLVKALRHHLEPGNSNPTCKSL